MSGKGVFLGDSHAQVPRGGAPVPLLSATSIRHYYASGPTGMGGIKRLCASDVCLTSVAYIGPKSRTERPR